MKIVVGIPAYGSFPPETETDYMRFMYYLGRRYTEHDFFLAIKRKSEQFRARNAICEEAAKVGADYLLMLDDDQVIDTRDEVGPSDAYEFLRKLLEHMEADPEIGVVGAVYFQRGGECNPVLMREHGSDSYTFMNYSELQERLQVVDVQGGGCMLIRMEALSKIGFSPFGPEHTYGTDIQLARKMRGAGFKVACDTSIKLGHVSNERMVITDSNRKLFGAKDVERRQLWLDRKKAEKQTVKDGMEFLGLETIAELEKASIDYDNLVNISFGERYPERLEEHYREMSSGMMARHLFVKHLYGGNPIADTVFGCVRPGIEATGVDWGCGIGYVGFELAKIGHKVHFIDLEGTAYLDFIRWRAEKYGLGSKVVVNELPEKANYVLFLDSLEHLVDWEQTLEIACSLLVPQGVLITNFPLVANVPGKPEHIFTDVKAFVVKMYELGMVPVTGTMYQKVA